MTTSLTLADLQRWEDHGATWRALEIAEDHVVLELCTCYGEPVELSRSDEREVIAHVHRALEEKAPSEP